MKRVFRTAALIAAAIALLAVTSPAFASVPSVPSNGILHWGGYFGADVTPSPAAISLPAPVKQLSTSNSTQYALLTNGQVWAWGQGTKGELGDGKDANSLAKAVQVQFPAGVTIAFLPYDAQPYDSALAVDTTGQAWAWGDNLKGEFCNGTTEAADVPVKVPLPGPVTALAGANGHALYVVNGATVYACGSNYEGVAGQGSAAAKVSGYLTPVAVTGLPAGVGVKAVTSAYANAGALLDNGDYYAWGYDAQGQVGNGTTSTAGVPVPQLVSLPGPVAQVYQGGSAAGNGQTVAMLSSRALYAWGSGSYGQLGNGQTVNEPSPVPFSAPMRVTYATLASGGATCYAVDTAGNVWAWGEGSGGQLGNGTRQNSLVPVEVATGASKVSSTAADAEAG